MQSTPVTIYHRETLSLKFQFLNFGRAMYQDVYPRRLSRHFFHFFVLIFIQRM